MKTTEFYSKNYKKIMIIPFIILIISIILLQVHHSTTGEYINKDVSLSGGISATIYIGGLDINNIKSQLNQKLPNSDISVRKLTDFTTKEDLGIILEASETDADTIKPILEEITNTKLTQDNFSIEEMGSSLGATFFKEMITAIISAFIVMAWVVFIIFGKKISTKIINFIISIIFMVLLWKFFLDNIYIIIVYIILLIALFYTYVKESIPSVAIILSAVLDIVATLAIVSLFDMKISTAGIAAFLMVLGYSIDTDILLTTRILKRKVGTIYERTVGALKTGLTMTITTIVALSVALIFTNSIVLKQMFTIILIALIIDLISTWLMNAGILIWYYKRKNIE